MITVENLDKTINKRKILSDISFSISKGECVGLLGPNGAGKTTLIKCMTGILRYEKGVIQFNSVPIAQHKKNIGYLSQHTDFKSWMTCEESLQFFGKLSGLDDDLLKEYISVVLEEVGLKEKGNYKVEQLSGGMKQRLGIAQAILHKPQLLILDEPVSALDPIGRNEMKKLINRLKKRTTIIISTHILDDASEFCDRYLILNNGLIVGNIHAESSKSDRKRILVTVENSPPPPVNFLSPTFKKSEWISKNTLLLTGVEELDLQDVINDFAHTELNITAIAFYEKGLEDIFLEMVSAT
ncbi:ABC transporter ATP-binding protein [Planococcus sp. S3-L1]|uniref:ABC transporter ATP-binding protein n=1 Tax=Planococcus sp. S3-L1 TaxID=3046200 RepID=UPI0024BBCC33|nr:ABC transporter ATP-binding protein [Planococcus sp. S3-L1]MDJ0332225.1 ABC transporter ATP-binding protein [Planococcus sp. S3-L1]